MDIFDTANNRIYIGYTDKLPEWVENDNQQKAIDKVGLMLKNYLELDLPSAMPL